jgi:uncharacterized protein YneF (UPF0154 family)
MSSPRKLVLDANILLRAVFGNKVYILLKQYEDILIADNVPPLAHNVIWNSVRAMMENYGRVPNEVARNRSNLSGMCPVRTPFHRFFP